MSPCPCGKHTDQTVFIVEGGGGDEKDERWHGLCAVRELKRLREEVAWLTAALASERAAHRAALDRLMDFGARIPVLKPTGSVAVTPEPHDGAEEAMAQEWVDAFEEGDAMSPEELAASERECHALGKNGETCDLMVHKGRHCTWDGKDFDDVRRAGGADKEK
jgi:hypothetical protein